MGPRPCGRGWSGRIMSSTETTALQWGHGLAAVDGYLPHALSNGEGNCFNGATALRPWMVDMTYDAPPPTGFNGATALRPWMDTMASVQ